MAWDFLFGRRVLPEWTVLPPRDQILEGRVRELDAIEFSIPCAKVCSHACALYGYTESFRADIIRKDNEGHSL